MLSLLNSLVGIIFGIYGFVFLLERIGLYRDISLKWLYAFIMHRYRTFISRCVI